MTLIKPRQDSLTPAVRKKFKEINKFFTAVVVILIIMVITLLATVAGIVIDSYRFKASSYQRLVEEIEIINHKIDSYKIDYFIDEKIVELKESNPYLK